MTKIICLLATLSGLCHTHGDSPPRVPSLPSLFARSNLVAWCIVPFDAKQRGPAERGEMVARLGFSKVAYDWRDQHVPTFEQEILEYKKRGIEFFAFWSTHDLAFELFAKHGLHPQIWLTAPSPAAATRDEQIRKAAAELLPIVERTRKAGCRLGLYNHGGWGGEPENLAAVCEYLRQHHDAKHVGIVYNFHHGHGHIEDFAAALARMKPFLLCLNINGMIRDADAQGKKILALAQGDEELAMLRVIENSGWHGPIGILCHRTDADAELVLADNLDGLDWLRKELTNPGSAGPRPAQRAPLPLAPPSAAAPAGNTLGEASVSTAFGKALRGGLQVPGRAEFRQRPLTVECWAKLDSAASFNILVASDTKASAEHWELYSVAASGTLSLFQPGRGEVFDSGVNICDGKWHYLAAIIEPERVRLFVDGKLVKDAPATPLKGDPLPGDLAFGRLVEGSIGCDGAVDNVRISRGSREISSVPTGPLSDDAATIGLWNFDVAASASENSSAAAPATAAAGGDSVSTAFGKALRGGLQVPGRAEFRQRPLTVECWAKLDSAASFNILVASDTKASAEHWELYTHVGSGMLSLYQPGRGGDFMSEAKICDGKWHYLAAVIEPERVRLFVDGKLVKDAPATPLQGEPLPGDLAFGRLVEGSIGCDGAVDNVRLSRGAREIRGVPAGPLPKDAATIGLWNFEATTSSTGKSDYWAVESAAERAALPEFKTIPAALPGELTPANGFPKRESFLTWHRSHGDNGGTRFSALDQINRANVTNLQVAWTYHSRDGSNYIQCNPIIVDGVMFAPTAGKHIVAVNADSGAELWRFKPDGKPAWRGLIYWPGRDGAGERIMFCAGKFLYALNPKSGQLIADFGESGKTVLPGNAQGDFGAATAGPTIFENIIVVPGFEKDVWGFDVVSGKQLWTFHTVPHPGEFGYDTWDRTEPYAANCWGGMAMDEVRGIAYITTGGPKNNFIGINHLGDNLFANCLIALDARTGKRLWHFQEIRHDIWDLDIPAPPNLGTITRNGKRVDVVTAVTKIGNTLLLDRVTGKPIFPFRLRRAPTSDVRGEVTASYQPDLELPERFSKQEFTAADLTDRTEEAAEFALTRFKSATAGWFRPCSEGRANLFFNIDGGAEWTGACIDPDTGRLYVSANHIGWLISLFRNDDPPDDPGAPRTRGQTVYETACASCHGVNRLGLGVAPPLRGLRHRLTDATVASHIRTGKNGMPAMPESQLSEPDLKALLDYLMLRDRPLPATNPPTERPVYSFAGYPRFFDHEGYPANKPPWGTLNCLDLNTGKLLWKVPLGEHPELTKQGVPKTGTENYGGAIVTAGGLVFCAGTRDRKIRAFDKDTGAELWAAKLPWVGNAPPATYQIDGRQFIVIAATGSKLESERGDAYVAFALPQAKP